MGDLIGSMGIMAIPLVLSSIVAIVVILSLFLTLKRSKVIPEGLAETAQKLAKSGNVTRAHIEKIREGSLLGRVLATGLESLDQPRHIMKENVEETGRHVIHSMDKYMTTLGTVAAIAPLLGLLGTVVGMIEVFSVITAQGVGSPTELAGGISKALITTAAGIIIAVPALIFHRHFRGKINDYAVEMEKQAIKLINVGQTAKSTVAPATAPKRRTAPQKPQATRRVPAAKGKVA